MSEGNAERGVLFRLKVEGDKQNAAAFDELATNAKKTEDAVVAALKRARAQWLKEHGKAGKKILDQQKKYIADELDAEKKKAAEQKRLIENQTRQRQEAMAALKDSQLAIADGFAIAGQGVLTLGRGITMLGLSGEEDIQKILGTLLRVQGVVDTFKGGLESIKGMVAAQKAYEAATKASVVAEEALGTARAGTAAAGGASAAGGIAKGGAGALAAVGGPMGIAAIVAAVAGTALIGTLLAPDTGEEGEGVNRGRKRRAKDFADENAREKAAFERRIAPFIRGRLKGIGEGVGNEQFESSLGLGGSRRESVERRIAGLQGQFEDTFTPSKFLAANIGGKEEAAVRAAEREELAKRLRDAAQERLQLVKQEQDVAIAGMKTQLSLAEKSLDVANRELQSKVDAKKTAEQRFGQLDGAEALRLKRLASKARAGDNLTREETAALGAFNGIGDIGNLTSSQNRRRAKELGFGDFARDTGIDNEISGLRFSAALADDNVTQLKTEIKVKVEGNKEELAKQFADKVAPLFENLEEAILARIDAERNRAKDAETVRRAG